MTTDKTTDPAQECAEVQRIIDMLAQFDRDMKRDIESAEPPAWTTRHIRALVDAIQNPERDALRAECAELEEGRQNAISAYDELEEQHTALKAEVAKLRKHLSDCVQWMGQRNEQTVWPRNEVYHSARTALESHPCVRCGEAIPLADTYCPDEDCDTRLAERHLREEAMHQKCDESLMVLGKERDALRAALTRIAEIGWAKSCAHSAALDMVGIARAALGEQ